MTRGHIDTLQVYWDEDPEPIGELLRRPDGSTGFRYFAGTSAERRVSHSLPVEGGRAEHPITFFDNLLPDGIQRERLARRLGISDTSTFAMLEAIGGDCAGALSIFRGPPPRSTARALRPLDEALLRRIHDEGVIPAALNEGLRLSLAGAQDKLPVVVREGQLFLPEGRVASTHILKLPNRAYPGIVDNEHFLLELAAAVGLPVVRSTRHALAEGSAPTLALLVERFDRRGGRRLHQEDLCQATGAPPGKKYEADGGPTLVDIVAILDAASSEPGDVLTLLKWQAFNVATGNNDGHAKNLSLLREPSVHLAPAYDLVCTRAWDALSKELALRVNGVRDAGAVGPVAWAAFAEEARLSARLVLDSVASVTEAVAKGARVTATRLMDGGLPAAPLERALEKVQAQSWRALRLLEIENPPGGRPSPARKKRVRR